MDKRALLKQLVNQLMADIAVLTQSALAAHGAATHTESKAEDQYDTRGLEASYLAGAQSKRVLDLQETLEQFRYLDMKKFGPETPIASTAFVELECDGKSVYYLLMPKGGGMTATAEGKHVQVITPQSPLGEALLGHLAGDQIQVDIQRVTRDYDIIAVG